MSSTAVKQSRGVQTSVQTYVWEKIKGTDCSGSYCSWAVGCSEGRLISRSICSIPKANCLNTALRSQSPEKVDLVSWILIVKCRQDKLMKYRNVLLCWKQGKFLQRPLANHRGLRSWAPPAHLPTSLTQSSDCTTGQFYYPLYRGSNWGLLLQPTLGHIPCGGGVGFPDLLLSPGQDLMTQPSPRTESKRELEVCYWMDLLSISLLPVISNPLLLYTHL